MKLSNSAREWLTGAAVGVIVSVLAPVVVSAAAWWWLWCFRTFLGPLVK